MLRIIGGEFRHRRLETPKDATKTRPLPDRVRTSLFSMLAGHVEGQTFVDVFAGTGSFGLEAISRGAADGLFVEKDREIVAILKRNIEQLGVGDRCEVHHGDALGQAAVARVPRPVHLVMFDPPYPLVVDPAQRGRVFEQFAQFVACLDDEGFAILRTPWPLCERLMSEDGEPIKGPEVDLTIEGAEGPETHVYGSTALHWYMRREA